MNCKKCGYLLTDQNITCPNCGDINENYGKSNVEATAAPVPFVESADQPAVLPSEPITPAEPIAPAEPVQTVEPTINEVPTEPAQTINEPASVTIEPTTPVEEPVVQQPIVNEPISPVITNEPISNSTVPKKKSKAGLVVIIILLIVAALGAGGYFGYKYFFEEKNNEPVEEKHENNLLFIDKMTDKEVFDMMYSTLAITYEDGISTTDLEKTLPTFKKNIPSKLTVVEKGVMYNYVEKYDDADKKDFVEEIAFAGTTLTDANSVTTITNLTGGGIIKNTEFVLKIYDYERGLQLYNYIKDEYTKMYPEESGNTLDSYELRGDLTFTANGIDNHQIQLCYDKNEDGSYKLWILETDWKD